MSTLMRYGEVVSRPPHKQEIVGAIPTGATITDIWQNKESAQEHTARVKAKIADLGLKYEDFQCTGCDLMTGVVTYEYNRF